MQHSRHFSAKHLSFVSLLGDVKRKAGAHCALSACGVPIKPVGLMGCYRSDTKPCGLSRTPYRLASLLFLSRAISSPAFP